MQLLSMREHAPHSWDHTGMHIDILLATHIISAALFLLVQLAFFPPVLPIGWLQPVTTN